MKIRIPKGWHRLRRGTKIKRGDKFNEASHLNSDKIKDWVDSINWQSKNLMQTVNTKGLIYIRKNKPINYYKQIKHFNLKINWEVNYANQKPTGEVSCFSENWADIGVLVIL